MLQCRSYGREHGLPDAEAQALERGFAKCCKRSQMPDPEPFIMCAVRSCRTSGRATTCQRSPRRSFTCLSPPRLISHTPVCRNQPGCRKALQHNEPHLTSRRSTRLSYHYRTMKQLSTKRGHGRDTTEGLSLERGYAGPRSAYGSDL